MQVLSMSEIYEVSGGSEDSEAISVAEGGGFGSIAGAAGGLGASYYGAAGGVAVGDAIAIGGALGGVIGVVAAGVGIAAVAIYKHYAGK